MAGEVHDLLRQVQSPNVHGLDNEMGFRVQQLDEMGDPEGWLELFRAVSLNCNITVARAAFEAACKCYPNKPLILKWGAMIVERYGPRSANE